MEVTNGITSVHSENGPADLLRHNKEAYDVDRETCLTYRIPTAFSFIVDDVDAVDNNRKIEDCTLEDSSPDSKEDPVVRIQQIKGEVEIRKNEFAKLLEEHEHVIRKLKQMENQPITNSVVRVSQV